MTSRRNFLKTSLVVAGGVALSTPAFAAGRANKDNKGIIYTADDPGMWELKVDSHAPKVEVNGKEVKLTTDHGMSEVHYIVRHTLVTEDGTVLGSTTFYPTDEEAVSTYTIPDGVSGKLYATSFCNKHDFWVTEFDI